MKTIGYIINAAAGGLGGYFGGVWGIVAVCLAIVGSFFIARSLKQ